MQIEYEATFKNIDKKDLRARLQAAGAKLLRPEFMQRRRVFRLPAGHEINGGWLRVRDEGERITMSLKVVDGDRIEDQKETQLVIDDFAAACSLLATIGCQEKAYQESKRELWILDGVDICIDEWPFLEPFVEIEGKSESQVKAAARKLSFDFSTAYFCSVDVLYSEKYSISLDRINNQTPRILFEMDNPF